MRMPHRRYPCSKQAHQSPTHTPETEQQERGQETPSRYGRSVHCKIAWIGGDQAYEEHDQGKDGSGQRSGQKAESATDGNFPNDLLRSFEIVFNLIRSGALVAHDVSNPDKSQ